MKPSSRSCSLSWGRDDFRTYADFRIVSGRCDSCRHFWLPKLFVMKLPRRAEIMAKKIAAKVAKTTATKIANAVKQQVAEEAQASGLIEGQADNSGMLENVEAAGLAGPKRRRAKNDSSLKKGGE